MKTLRPTISLVALIAMITGCSQSGVGTAVPQGSSASAMAHRLSGSSGELVYVNLNRETYILAYPSFAVVAKMPGFRGYDVASDPNNGDVFMGTGEYAHGATKPFAMLSLPSGEHIGSVAFDPTTDNIAFALYNDQGRVWVAVYPTLNDTPTVYYDSEMVGIGDLGYDGNGNLFVESNDSHRVPFFAELLKGSNTFINLTSTQGLAGATNIGWDGQYLVIRTDNVLNRVAASGLTMTIVGQTTLKDAIDWSYVTFSLQGAIAIGPHQGHKPKQSAYLGVWNYPKGGKAFELVKNLRSNHHFDPVLTAVFSVAPSH